MRIEIGDMWDTNDDEVIMIPTNAVIKRVAGKAELVMGKGVAQQAADRFPSIKRKFGKAVSNKLADVNGLGLQIDDPDLEYYGFLPPMNIYDDDGKDRPIGAIQTKKHWRDPSTPELLKKSLTDFAEYLENKNSPIFNRINIPMPGIGNGKVGFWKVVSLLQNLEFPRSVRFWITPEFVKDRARWNVGSH